MDVLKWALALGGPSSPWPSHHVSLKSPLEQQGKRQQAATEQQLRKIIEIQSAVKELPKEYFAYDAVYKRFSLKQNVEFIINTNQFKNVQDEDYLLKVGKSIKSLTDTGYQGIGKFHNNSKLPKKKTRKNPLTKEDKRKNRELSSERALNENVIGMIKRFKIIADRYRNRRKRFGLRFNLLAGIYNLELKN